MDGFWRKIFRRDRKIRIKILCVFIIGVIFMASGKLFSAKDASAVYGENVQPEEEITYISQAFTDEEYTEKRLEEIFSRVDGAGNVKVMVRTASYGEIFVAEETKHSENTTSKEDGASSVEVTEEKSVVLLENKDGSQTPLVIKNVENPIEGILIVAEGGGNETVKSSLVSAASALLNLSEDKIQVLKMK